MNEFKRPTSTLLLLLFLFLLPALACGSETPTKVGEVDQGNESVPAATGGDTETEEARMGQGL